MKMFENPPGGAHRATMNDHRIIDLPDVTAGRGHYDAACAAGAENVLVARGETGESQRQPTKPVIVIRIGASQIDHQLRAGAPENLLERRGELLQIESVAAAVRQVDIQVAARLDERKVVRAVQRDSENPPNVGTNRRRTVALMNVAIDDRRTLDETFGEYDSRHHRRVVENAESFAVRGMRVMRAAGKIDRTFNQCFPRRHRIPWNWVEAHAFMRSHSANL
ncbi:MAG TPA: hypothetical protein PKY22_11570 [Accumulibacter sp.]|nr:hypothetical protein [Accumulibacter sp.]